VAKQLAVLEVFLSCFQGDKHSMIWAHLLKVVTIVYFGYTFVMVLETIKHESLILAQNERWRHA